MRLERGEESLPHYLPHCAHRLRLHDEGREKRRGRRGEKVTERNKTEYACVWNHLLTVGPKHTHCRDTLSLFYFEHKLITVMKKMR